MAVRNTPGKRLVGNPLGGILRDLDRQTRSTTRRRGSRPAGGVEERPEEAGGGPVPVTVVTASGPDGRARWNFPGRFTAAPVLSAVALTDVPVVVTVEEFGSGHAVVRTWGLDGRPAPYVGVHVWAVPGPGEGAATLTR